MTEERLLEWVKVFAPLVLSWPLVVVVLALLFKGPIETLIGRFVPQGTGTLKARIGPLELEQTTTEIVRTSKQASDSTPPSSAVIQVVVQHLAAGYCRYLLRVSGKPMSIDEHRNLLSEEYALPRVGGESDNPASQQAIFYSFGFWAGAVMIHYGLVFNFETADGKLRLTVFPEALPLLAQRLESSAPPQTRTRND